jgi:hypothetical protein
MMHARVGLGLCLAAAALAASGCATQSAVVKRGNAAWRMAEQRHTSWTATPSKPASPTATPAPTTESPPPGDPITSVCSLLPPTELQQVYGSSTALTCQDLGATPQSGGVNHDANYSHIPDGGPFGSLLVRFNRGTNAPWIIKGFAKDEDNVQEVPGVGDAALYFPGKGTDNWGFVTIKAHGQDSVTLFFVVAPRDPTAARAKLSDLANKIFSRF